MPTQEELINTLRQQLPAQKDMWGMGAPNLQQESQKPTSELFKQFILKSILQGPMALRMPGVAGGMRDINMAQSLAAKPEAPYVSPNQLSIRESMLPPDKMMINDPKVNFETTPLQKRYMKGEINAVNDPSPYTEQINSLYKIDPSQRTPYQEALLKQLIQKGMKPPGQ